jgi:hypothetical protein
MVYVLLKLNALHVSALKRHSYDKFFNISKALEIALF